MLEGGERGLEAAFADEAPGAQQVGPDLHVNLGHVVTIGWNLTFGKSIPLGKPGTAGSVSWQLRRRQETG
ncbi:hypothetical protein Pen01_74630 [Phytomonospora endophytica]|nr:hypothetical protein Pen01_74630 [Phytomonospora endophytica]